MLMHSNGSTTDQLQLQYSVVISVVNDDV